MLYKLKLYKLLIFIWYFLARVLLGIPP